MASPEAKSAAAFNTHALGASPLARGIGFYFPDGQLRWSTVIAFPACGREAVRVVNRLSWRGTTPVRCARRCYGRRSAAVERVFWVVDAWVGELVLRWEMSYVKG